VLNDKIEGKKQIKKMIKKWTIKKMETKSENKKKKWNKILRDKIEIEKTRKWFKKSREWVPYLI
jgi:chemotaxis regulatin CheY-phosphate phosphatase CheZ